MMQAFEAMFDAAAAAFRRRLSLAVQAMHAARTPGEFCRAEREVVDLAREMVVRCVTSGTDLGPSLHFG